MNNTTCFLFMAGLVTAIFSGCRNQSTKTVTPVPENVRVDTIGMAGAMSQDISFNGTVQESVGINVSFQVSGTITQVPVERGQYVKKGQLLATVDETTYRNQYNAQLAQQLQAEDNYNRTNEVFKKGSIAEVRKVQAESNFEQARATASASYQNIVHCSIYSPAEGYIGEKSAEAGASAAPGVAAFKIVKLESVKVSVAVPEAEIRGIRNGQPAIVRVSSLDNRMFTGKIAEIAVVSSDRSHNYDVRILVANPGTLLKPGMLASVRFPARATALSGYDAKISVPLIALQVDEKGSHFVYVVDSNGGKALRRQVSIGDLLQESVIVNSGLATGDRVIVSGYHKLTDQSPVHIIP